MLLVLVFAACAPTGGDPAPLQASPETAALDGALRETRGAALAPGDLRVRMAFGAAADLDLYVTDTLQESVYFARRESRTGGRLGPDARCEDPAPRIETALYPDAAPGRYRVGVDYPQACEDDASPVAFAVEVEHRGERRTLHGVAVPQRFQPAVWEFEIEEGSGLARPPGG